MIRMRSSSSVCDTMINRPLSERPIVQKRSSPIECTMSIVVREKGSLKTVLASEKETPCFLRLASDFSRSHSNRRPMRPSYSVRGACDRRQNSERCQQAQRDHPPLSGRSFSLMTASIRRAASFNASADRNLGRPFSRRTLKISAISSSTKPIRASR